MILYQMAKRLDERNRLQRTIHASTGDVNALTTQKEQVEEQLLTQASAWSEDRQDEFLLEAVAPDMTGMQQADSYY
ncbi:hypothetical protein SAMN02799630_03052 [Paenibacillus sp. UNCCL117]|uniref:hypothetical protein n=1 Tax=unclassified Paenibacillus TaxID=185978 RepID=UPI0008832DE9|nr:MULTISPECIES: hypothetical protein [unclassified Paenibacillus]SDE21630.1 hypothetical protein SAMN04488602_1224 [Paenibacillus sp. cl123]SFW43211.1 hypothetical protein SAMN02799630_03052 [Paenibacillus sp. UNCCL117]